ncbi:MAG: hypothetical protein JSV49_07635 [Thermoplasmata archaeon]|nr:MAG: hypothetical protein JSV49_07635 [Thermoplasmata archaeon]
MEVPFRFPHKKDKGTDTDWVELTQQDVNKQFQGCQSYSEAVVKTLGKSIPKLKHLQSYFLLVVGSREDYWFETRIDVERLKMTNGMKERTLRELSSKTRLEMLSETLGDYKTLLANRVTGSRKNSMVIGFSSKKHELNIEYTLTKFLMAVDMEDTYNAPNLAQKEMDVIFNQARRAFIPNFGKFLLYHTKLKAMYDIGYIDASARTVVLKTKSTRMQRKINDLIRESQKLSQEKEMSSSLWRLKDTESHFQKDYDEGLLYNTSIYFSNITELLQTVSNSIYQAKENTYFQTKSATTMAFEPLDNPLTLEKSEHISLIDEFNRFSEQVTHSFESLKLDIEATQTSLRNTVDILKTFLEGKQRQSSQRSSKTLGLLTVVFACFVFIDMISNYFIFYLESTRTSEEFSEMVIFMIITLWPSLLMFVLLYFVFLKKMWD